MDKKQQTNRIKHGILIFLLLFLGVLLLELMNETKMDNQQEDISIDSTESTTEKAESTTEKAESTTEKAEATTEQAEATTEKAESTTEKAESTTEKIEVAIENIEVSKEETSKKIDNNLEITDIGTYSGPYFEDGTNEQVEDIRMITLKNTSDEDLQYAEIMLEFEADTAQFAVTNLPAGESVMILEKNRMKYEEQEVKRISVENVVFLEKMNLYEDIFAITGLDGVINVKNISSEDIDGEIYIYYKNFNEDGYLGGITYRIRLEQGLKAGEIRQLRAQHFSQKNSKFVMVSYVE